MTIAILSALPEEQQGFSSVLTHRSTISHAGRSFVCGMFANQSIVLALSGIGKVAAATTTAALIEHFGAQQIIFTGVAGGVGPDVQVGDVVVAQNFIQHDMDVRPLFPRWQVPGYASPLFACNSQLHQGLLDAAITCVQEAPAWQLPLLKNRTPKAHTGLIASGDQFIVSASVTDTIHRDLLAAGHHVLAVEMEGAAIAQTCADYGKPFAAVRTISDRADEQAHVDFPAFVQSVASRYAHHIVMGWLKNHYKAMQ